MAAGTNGDSTSNDGPHVVILGGGFGGLYAARALRRAKARVTLVDRHNYHLFQPLLYQVATAALNPSDIAYPIRHILRRQKNAEVLLGEAVGVDPARRKVLLADGEIAYDKLIVATGATHSYFGHPEWAERAPGLKGIEDAIEIRRRVLLAYELAERETDPARRDAWMTFVIVGAGPTGVELAGAFAEIARQALPGDFRHIDPAKARVIVVEGAPRVLPTYTEESSARALKQLTDLGAEVRPSSFVTAIDDEGVTYKTGQDGAPQVRLPARTVIWAAGVAASPIAKSLGVPLDRAGRVKVEPDLTIPGHPDVFVIGDLAALDSDGKPVPGVAPAAIQEGEHAAKNIQLALDGKPCEPFHYRDKGALATIGRSKGVAEIGRLKLKGLIAWLAWLFIHIYFLIGFRNRVLVITQWAWYYVTRQRGARLITGETIPYLLPKSRTTADRMRAQTPIPAPPPAPPHN